MIRWVCLLAALVFRLCWVPSNGMAGDGADSLQIGDGSAIGDTLPVTSAMDAENPAADSLGFAQSQSKGLVWNLWIPIATVLAVGGVLLLLYTQRGN